VKTSNQAIKSLINDISASAQEVFGHRCLSVYIMGSLARETTRVPRRSDYVKRPVLSATIHPDIKRTLVAMSKRTGMSVSQVTDEVLYTGLIEMQEMDEL